MSKLHGRSSKGVAAVAAKRVPGERRLIFETVRSARKSGAHGADPLSRYNIYAERGSFAVGP